MLERLDETIVAVSSGAGHAPRGIVRLSGPRAVPIAARLCPPTTRGLNEVRGGASVSGEAGPSASVRLPAILYVFRAPHSYTRQDLVEIHTIGSPAALEWLRRAAISLGAAAAQPGEFTARAFVNGAMDLSAAEGVAAVIRARTDTQLRASRRMMVGALHASLEQVRDELAELLALVEADIDFAEEPIEFVTPAALRERLDVLGSKLAALLAGAPTQEQLDALPRVLLLGAPNVGKSSLMNALTGIPRALCAPVAGTTRDVLSAPLRVGRGEVVLLDAAGIDESEDPLIGQARAMAVAAAERVDLVCLVVDITTDSDEIIVNIARALRLPRVVIAANKADLASPESGALAVSRLQEWALGAVVPVSALHRTGLEQLRSAFAEALGELAGTTGSEAISLTERQQAAIGEARDVMHRAAIISLTAAETIDCAETIAFELREALDALAAVTGAVTTDDLLARVFANFCIGK